MEHMESKAGIYGLMAEFKDGDALMKAATRTYEAGYRQIDAFTPFPVHGLAEAMGHTDRKVQKAVLGGGLFGLVAGYGLCYWTSVTEGIGGIFSGYAHNIGGRPLHSWPSFIVPTFETTILFAALTAVASMIAFNGLPMPYHPVFNVERFREHATTDGFFLCIESADPKFDGQRTREFLESLGASEVNDVAH
ncbi:MAG: DUF3341 domain-containing protein [Acidobacteria bacterium]|nr:DUF3341 domain-containing protein [Acidobacteriota bacterium]